MTDIQLGTRKLQRGARAFVFNVPIIAVRTLNLHEGNALRVSITDNAIRIEKDPTSGDLPARLALPAGV